MAAALALRAQAVLRPGRLKFLCPREGIAEGIGITDYFSDVQLVGGVYGCSPPMLSRFEPSPWAVSLTGLRTSTGLLHVDLTITPPK